MTLYLIGTVHVDPDGPRRLQKLLSYLRPDCITLEIEEQHLSPAVLALQNQQKMMKNSSSRKEVYAMASRYAPGITEQFIDTVLESRGFEIKSTQTYARNTGVPITCVDEDRCVFPQVVSGIRPLVDYTVKLLHHTKVSDINTLRLLCARDYDADGVPFGSIANLFDRDSVMLEKIRGKTSHFKTVVHVGGLSHTHGAYHNLFERAKDLDPVRIKLCDANTMSSK